MTSELTSKWITFNNTQSNFAPISLITFAVINQTSPNLQGSCRNNSQCCLQNYMENGWELTSELTSKWITFNNSQSNFTPSSLIASALINQTSPNLHGSCRNTSRWCLHNYIENSWELTSELTSKWITFNNSQSNFKPTSSITSAVINQTSPNLQGSCRNTSRWCQQNYMENSWEVTSELTFKWITFNNTHSNFTPISLINFAVINQTLPNLQGSCRNTSRWCLQNYKENYKINQASANLQGSCCNTSRWCLQNYMENGWELTSELTSKWITFNNTQSNFTPISLITFAVINQASANLQGSCCNTSRWSLQNYMEKSWELTSELTSKWKTFNNSQSNFTPSSLIPSAIINQTSPNLHGSCRNTSRWCQQNYMENIWEVTSELTFKWITFNNTHSNFAPISLINFAVINQTSPNLQGSCRNNSQCCLQNYMENGWELTSELTSKWITFNNSQSNFTPSSLITSALINQTSPNLHGSCRNTSRWCLHNYIENGWELTSESTSKWKTFNNTQSNFKPTSLIILQ